MERKVTAVYTAFSVLAFVFLASWLAFTFFQTRSSNLVSAASTFEDVSNSTAVSLNSAGRFDAPHFRSYIRSLFLEIPSIDVLTISAPNGGVQYVYARKASDLVSPHVANDRWSGSIRYSKLTQNMFSSPLPLTARSGGAPFHIRAVFTVLSRSNLYEIARTLLIFLLSFVILTLIVLLLTPRSAARSAGEARTEARAAPTDRESEERESRRGAGRPGQPAPASISTAFDSTDEGPAHTDNSVIPLGPPPQPASSTAPAPEAEGEPSGGPPAAEPLSPAGASSTGPETEAAIGGPQAESESTPRAGGEKSESARSTPPEAATVEESDELARLTESAGEPGAEREPKPSAETPEPQPPPLDLSPSHAETEKAVGPDLAEETEPDEDAPAMGAEELPPGVRLPSLREVAGEPEEAGEVSSEIFIYEQLADDAVEEIGSPEEEEQAPEPLEPESPTFEITEIDEHAEGAAQPQEPSSGYYSAQDELADLEDFEDLERIDGSHGEEPAEPPPRPRSSPPPQARPAQGDTPASEPVHLPQQSAAPTRGSGTLEGEPSLTDDVAAEEGAVTLPEAVELPESVELPEAAEILEAGELPEADELPEAAEPPAPEANRPPESEVEELLPLEGEDLVLVESVPEEQEAPSVRSEDHEKMGSAPPSAGGGKHARELFNPESGLAWRDHLEQRLSFELDRAASFDQDLAVSIVRFARPADDVARLNYAHEIRTYFPFHDLCFEYEKDAFAIVLPNTDIDQAIRSMENFNDKMNEDRPGSPKMLFGLSARNGRLLGSERLLTEAESAIEKAREDGRNAIFALRVDPGKYREFIKSTLK